ncbi:MAG: transposase [Thermoguttaceae bacterium]
MPEPSRRYPSDLTDAQWDALRQSIPAGSARGANRRTSMRAVIDAILYITHRDVAWRKLPKNFPPWQTAYGYYARWKRDGTWQEIRNALNS